MKSKGGPEGEKITVYVDGRPVELFRGMKVRHALISVDQKLFKAVEESRITVRDGNDYEIGLDGALANGSKIFLKQTA